MNASRIRVTPLVAPRVALSSAAATVVSLVPEDDDSAEIAMHGALTLRYNTVKSFLSLLGETSMLGAATGGMRVLAGVRRLPALEHRDRWVEDQLIHAASLVVREVDGDLF